MEKEINAKASARNRSPTDVRPCDSPNNKRCDLSNHSQQRRCCKNWRRTAGRFLDKFAVFVNMSRQAELTNMVVLLSSWNLWMKRDTKSNFTELRTRDTAETSRRVVSTVQDWPGSSMTTIRKQNTTPWHLTLYLVSRRCSDFEPSCNERKLNRTSHLVPGHG